MLETFYSLAAFSTMLLTAFGLGRPLLRSLNIGDEDAFSSLVWSLGLGFATAGWLLSILALGNLFSPLAAGILTIGGSFWGLGELACLYLAARHPAPTPLAELEELAEYSTPNSTSVPRVFKNCLLLGVVLTLGGTFIAALAPPTSPSTMSQALAFPKAITLGSTLADAVGDGAATPRLMGMTYSWAIALDGPVTANLLSYFFGVLLAAGAAILARGVFDRQWSWCAGAMLLLSPGMVYQMSAANDDLPTALLATLALSAWWRATVELASPKWFVLVGIFLGTALASKFCAVGMLIAVAVAWSIEVARHGEHRPKVAVGAIQSGLLATLIAAPWWVWTFINHGKLSHPESGAALLTEIGPWFLALLPGLLFVRRLRSLHLIAWVAACYLVAATLVMPQTRSFAMLLPLLAILVTWVCMELTRLPRSSISKIGTSLAVIALTMIVLNLTPVLDRWKVVMGRESREEYLTARVGAFTAAEVANRVLPENARLLSQDPCGLYFDCAVFPLSESGFDGQSSTSVKIACEWLAKISRQGYSHLLFCEASSEPGNIAKKSTDAASNSIATAQDVADRVLPLTEYFFTDAAGTQRHYRLVMLRK
jgi:hypothetical protein